MSLFSAYETEFIKNSLKRPEEDYNKLESLMNAKIENLEEKYTRIERNYRSLVEGLNSAGIGIVIVSNNYEIQFQNLLISKIFGDGPGKKCYEKYMNRNEPCDPCPMKNALEADSTCSLEIEGIDGKFYRTTSTPLSINDGGMGIAIEIIEDISVQKKTLNDLKRETGFTKAAINAQRDTFFVFDPTTGKAIRWNKAFLEISGYSDEEINSLKAPESYYNPEDLAKIPAANQNIEKGGTSTVDLNLITKSGASIPFEYVGSGIFDDEGNLKYIVSVGRNITERKKLEENLARERKLSANILEMSPTGIVLVNSTGNITFANKAAERILELERSDIFDRTYNDPRWVIESYDGKSFPDENLPFSLIKSTKMAVYDVKHAIRKTNGTRTLLSINAAPFFDGAGGWNGMVASIEDVTEKHKMQEAIRKERETARQYLELAGVMIVTLDREGRISLINRKGCEILKVDKENIIGKHWFNTFIPSETRAQLNDVFKRIINGKIELVEFYENLVVDSTGKLRDISWHNTMIYDDEGNIAGTLSSGEDITDKKKAERALIESEKKYRLITETINDMIAIVNHNYETEYANIGAHQRVLGYEGDEFFSIKGINHIHPDERDDARKILIEAFQNNDARSMLRVRTKLGSIVWVESILKRFVDVDGETKILIVSRDVTENKEWQDKLRESEERYRGFVENFQGIAFQGDFEFKPIFFHGSVEEITGYTEKDFIEGDLRWINIVHDEDKKRLFDDAPSLRRIPNSSLNREYRIIKKDGGTSWIQEFIKNVCDENGVPNIVQGCLYDITERKLAEQKLKKSEERLDYLLSSSPTVLYTSKASGDYGATFISKNVKEITGHDPEEFTLDPGFWIDNIHPDDVIHTESSLSELAYKDTLVYYYRFKLKDGTYHWMRDELKVMRDASGEAIEIIGSMSDITDQKLSELKLEESEEKFRNIAENSHLGIVILQDNVVKYTNKRMSEMFGYTVEEMLAWKPMDFLNIFAPEHKEFGKEQALKKQAGDLDVILHYPLHVVKKSGEMFWIDNISKTIMYQGRPADLVMEIDITDKMDAEQKLVESEAKYRDLFYNSPFGIFLFDEKGNLIEGNTSAAESFSGFSSKESIGKNFMGIITLLKNADELKEIFINREQERASGKKLEPIEFKLIRQDGEERWIYWSSSMLKAGNKNLIHAIANDITSNKLAEIRIRESEEKFRTIAEQSLIGIGIVQDNKMVYANERVADMFGYPLDEVMQWTYDDIVNSIHPEDRVLVLDQMRMKLEGSDSYMQTYRFRGVKKSGVEIWIQNFTRSIQFGGKKASFVSFVDITGQVKAREELVKLNQLKTDIIRRTSHELKTPLIAIKGYSNLIISRYKDRLDEEVLNALSKIEHGSTRLEKLISDVLKTSELESERVTFKKKKENFSLLIKECVDEFGGLMKMRKHSLKLHLQENLHAYFDKDELYHVVSNLLINAIKYTPLGGTIEIELIERGNLAVFSIMDNGLGFTEEEKGEIFKQFGKIERIGQKHDIILEGSGFGLYIAKRIVEMHGGKIWVESDGSGMGSTFFFYIPIGST